MPYTAAPTPSAAMPHALPSAQLITQPNLAQPGARYFRNYTAGDDFYELLLAAHHNLTSDQSAAFNSRLILLLSNHIGDISVLRQAIAVAAADLPPAPPVTPRKAQARSEPDRLPHVL